MVAGIPWMFYAVSFIMHKILVCSFNSQIFELCHNFQRIYHYFYVWFCSTFCWQCSQCWEAATGWMVQGSDYRKGMRFFLSPKGPDHFLGPPSPLLSGYWGFGWGIMLTIHLHLTLRLWMSGVIPKFPYSFMSWTGTTLTFFCSYDMKTYLVFSWFTSRTIKLLHVSL